MSRSGTIQVQFRPEEAKRIQASADALGLSDSAFVRRMVLSKVLVPTWWVPPMDATGMTVRALRSTGAGRMQGRVPDFYLELFYETQGGDAAYRVFDSDLAPMSFDGLQNYNVLARELHRGRVMMGGSHMLWEVVRSVEDVNQVPQLVWLLAADRRDDSEPASKG